MPLSSGPGSFKSNVRTLMGEVGKSPHVQSREQALAIAYAKERKRQQGGSVYETPLSREEESRFQDWKQRNAPHDSGADYDLRGAFKAGVSPDPQSGHWPDTYKKPNHPTFSDQSKYALPGMAGHWDGDTYSAAPPPFQAGGLVGGLVDHDRDPELPRVSEGVSLEPMMAHQRDPAYIQVIQRLLEGQKRLNAMQPQQREQVRRFALGGIARLLRGGSV